MRYVAVVLIAVAIPSLAWADGKVEFTGNQTLSSDQLRAAISPAIAGALFDGAGVVRQEILERDVLLISAYYWDRGYAQVKVGAPRVEPSRVSIPIDEGHVFTISGVAVKGDLIGSATDNLAKLRVKPGVTFSRTMIANDRETLSVFYQDLGYAYANVLPLTKLDTAHDTIDLTIEVERGKLSHFERILVTGNRRTTEASIRHALGVGGGELFNQTKLEKGRARIKQLGVTSVVIATVRGSADDRVEVHVEIDD